jgi:pimeloyl-ACP methyl ester carboxylesterase
MNIAAGICTRGYTQCRFGQMHFLAGQPASYAPPTAPTLVMLHQTPSTSEEYAPLLRRLARDRHVISFDTPGYGMSDAPPGPQSIFSYAAAFCDALDAMRLPGPIDLFGYHTGTLMAVEIALARPSLIGRLVLSGVPMRTDQECADRLAAARASPQPTEDGAALMAQSRALWNYVVTNRNSDVTLARAADVFAEKNKSLHRGWWAYEGVWSYDYQDRFVQLTQPVLCLQPHDGLQEQTRQACALIPRGICQDMPGLSRDIFDAAPETLHAAISAFLN